MKRILTALAVTAFSATLAIAADDPMASRYGNTIVAKGANGKEVARTYYNADGTMSRKTADGKEMKGTWKMEGDKVCITLVDPEPNMPARVCLPFPGAKNVGDTWDVTLPDGTKVKATLQKGRP